MSEKLALMLGVEFLFEKVITILLLPVGMLFDKLILLGLVLVGEAKTLVPLISTLSRS